MSDLTTIATGIFPSSGVKAGKVYGVVPTNDNTTGIAKTAFDFTSARNGPAYRTNENGLLEEMANDVCRVEYPTCPSLLLEPASTNLWGDSEPISGGSGVTYQSFDWGGQPFTNSSYFGDNSITRYSLYGSLVNSVEYTISVYVVMDDLSKPSIGSGAGYDFALRIGGNNIVEGDISFKDIGNNIWRVSGVRAATANLNLNGILKTATNSIKGFNVVGYQIEEGQLTSYIKTEGTTVTRPQDTLVQAVANSDMYNSEEGVLMMDIAALVNDGSPRYIVLGDGTASNYIRLGYTSILGSITFTMTVGGSVQASYNLTTTPITQFNKIAARYKENNVSLWVNGVSVFEDLIAIAYPQNTLDRCDIGGNGIFAPFFGRCKQVSYFPSFLTDEEMAQLTGG